MDMTPVHEPPLLPIEILLVDDDLADIKLTKRALENDRILNNIHVVRDGSEALAFLRQRPPYEAVPRPDIILLDLNMPRIDGRQVLREVKTDPDLKAIPIIVLTTSEDQHDVAGSYSDHANSYVAKPLDTDQFKKAIFSVKDYWISVVKLPRG